MKRFLYGFRYAIKGIALALAEERNLKVHFVIGALTVAGGFYFSISVVEWCFVILCIALVIVVEMINTATEDLVDLVTTEWKPLAGKIKDIVAGAVLVASIASLIVGIIIFRKYLMII